MTLAQPRSSASLDARPRIDVPPQALVVQEKIVSRVKRLLGKRYCSCLSPDFKKDYAEILRLFGMYQLKVRSHNRLTVSCGPGCGVCCCHWPEDVYSFEGIIIAEHLRSRRPHEIPRIVERLKKDVMWLARIKNAVNQVSEGKKKRNRLAGFDPYDIVLSSFYQLNRPCPLLGKNGDCTIYPLRPLACRIYVSFSHPKLCGPAYINEGKTLTCLLDLEQDAGGMFDELHFMYDACDGDTGLRSMLLTLLTKR